ncbi:hypothetical protein [Mycobacterium kubicae]|uniref:hypothetical protein n=1 Tax=Mycobacterium kubicae TaxID=120959 RepID=UPI0007FC2BA3|nr:hypothetical protein [Mycobacterium kubicae]OBF22609.1 hypothetical protein A5725_10175 [Mycobacterium kubicae]OBK44053.1 hypothetical protein A5657_04700 [Mycobacterium kubicae]QNI06167.1 hypothetical protein GAN17_07600 [Mycobacterium kubicae]
MAKYLVLYSSAHRTGQELRWRLATDVDLEDVRRRLDAAEQGEFVKVPVVLEDELETLLLRVQPHEFGAWLVLDLPEVAGSPAPLLAARARMPDFGQIFRQVHEAADAVRESKRQQRK